MRAGHKTSLFVIGLDLCSLYGYIIAHLWNRVIEKELGICSIIKLGDMSRNVLFIFSR